MSDTLDLTSNSSSNSDIVNQALSALIQYREDAFLGRIRPYYLQGSHGDGTAVDTSKVGEYSAGIIRVHPSTT